MSTAENCILDEAAEWLVVMHAGTVSAEDRRAWMDWRSRSAAHEQAWLRAERLLGTLGGVPAALAMPALDRPRSRRAALAKLAALLAVAPAAWSAWRWSETEGWTADIRSATGERREIRLDDGTRLVLDTASAIDVRYDAGQRVVLLRAGEIYIETAGDPRPFEVHTRDGRLRALGTRFSVRLQDGATRLAVQEGAVRVATDHDTLVLNAGQQTAFSVRGIAPAAASDPAAIAWTRGMLLADGMPLGALVAELSRYRKGVTRCDPAVAALRVSGAFPLSDTDRSLAMLAATYPVTVASRLGGYWITVGPA
ncbi:FecR domain-containing protein [Achromobacter xylosoxidans]|uniref:FecR domain-containing protein n=1 Tax=Alcaligenes xylosoxydans xylosoxydans TaxID=85698 RepID=UPI000B48C759|nr:FecR domain-containing protein [Achromobacter xylosoxidans]